MDWIKENQAIFIILLVAIILVILVILIVELILISKVKKSISSKALFITSGLNYDSDNLGESLVLTIFNNNYRDMILHDFGFIYKNQQISFIDEYTEKKGGRGRACVPSRSSLSYKVNPERIEKFVVAHNFNATSIDKIRLYVTDSLGVKVVIKDRALTKIFDRRQQARLKLAKLKIHDEKNKEYQATHEGALPFSDKIWRIFHKKDVKVPEIIKTSQQYFDDKSLSVETTPHTNYNPAPIQTMEPDYDDEEDAKVESEDTPIIQPKTKTDTRDMKVTFIDLDVPLKAKNIGTKDKKLK